MTCAVKTRRLGKILSAIILALQFLVGPAVHAQWTQVTQALGAPFYAQSLQIDPANSNIIYVATPTGISRTADGGRTWTVSSQAANVIAIDPTLSSTLVAGTSSGIYKSTDSGTNWSLSGLAGQYINSVAIAPGASGAIFASGGSTIYRSLDRGTTWTTVTTTPQAASQVMTDPGSASTVYAAYGEINSDASSSGGILKSTDGGTTWSSTALTGQSVIALTVDPTSSAVLYAGTFAKGIFKSTNGGAAWSAISTGLNITNITSVAAVTVDQRNSTIIYAAIPTTGGGIYKSTNGGSTWVAATPLGDTNCRMIAIDPTASSTLIAGSQGGGIYKSVDTAASWTALNPGGLTKYSIRVVAFDPTAANTLYLGANDGTGGGSGQIFKSTDSGKTWAAATSGLANRAMNTIIVDPTNPQTLYAGVDLSGSTGGVAKSTNGGTSWTPSGLQDRAVFWLAFDPTNSSTLYAATPFGIAKSIDAGATWNTGGTSFASRLVVVDPVTPTTLYAPSFTTGVYKSTNGGATWVASASGFKGASLTALGIDPAQPQLLYAGTFQDGVFKSTDGGLTWTSSGLTWASLGLTATNQGSGAFVSSIIVSPSVDRAVYVASTSGTFQSLDQGATWYPINARNSARDYLDYLAFSPGTPRTLYAVRKGLWRSDLLAQNGWWWNPKESGRGYSIEMINGRIFLAAYLYRDDGTPAWCIANESLTATGFSGTLYDVTGSQTLNSTGAGTTGTGTTRVNISGTFTSPTKGSLTLSGGAVGNTPVVVPIERFPFGTTTLSPPNRANGPESGWWWNPSEPGVGYFLEQQSDSIFLASYFYGTNQLSIWYYALGQTTLTGSTATLTGQLQQASGGPTFISGPKTLTSANAGNVTLQFTSTTTATITLPSGRVVPIQRYTSF
jgi:photosystem II stability/assembly factor-like uncharacterized protein